MTSRRLLRPLLRCRPFVTGLARFGLLSQRLIVVAERPLVIRHHTSHTVANDGALDIEKLLLAHDLSLLRSLPTSLFMFSRDLCVPHIILFICVDVFGASSVVNSNALVVEFELPMLHHVTGVDFLVVDQLGHVFLIDALGLEDFQVIWVGEVQVVLVFAFGEVLHRG